MSPRRTARVPRAPGDDGVGSDERTARSPPKSEAAVELEEAFDEELEFAAEEEEPRSGARSATTSSSASTGARHPSTSSATVDGGSVSPP